MEDQTFERTIAADLTEVGRARRAFRAWLAATGLPPDEVDCWELAFSELVANACEASPGGSTVDLLARRRGQRVTLRVANRSDGASLPRVPGSVPPAAVQGRGLLVVERLLDGVVFQTDGDRVVATAWSDPAARRPAAPASAVPER